MTNRAIPEHLVYPLGEFASSHKAAMDRGREVLSSSSVTFVGLARDCEAALKENLYRVEAMRNEFKDWSLHIESNDCIDGTAEVLADFCFKHSRHASFRYRALGRERWAGEFGGRRTMALAEYRADCQAWVREQASGGDYTIVLDFDMQGGWSYGGLLAGTGFLASMDDAFGMSSVSLAEYTVPGLESPAWVHYDAWALRGVGQPECYWDSYTAGSGMWMHHFIPPVGSPPIVVASAFGGMTIYKTGDYLSGEYDGSNDCEHVAFHRSICNRDGGRIYLCPSMRTIMHRMA